MLIIYHLVAVKQHFAPSGNVERALILSRNWFYQEVNGRFLFSDNGVETPKEAFLCWWCIVFRINLKVWDEERIVIQNNAKQ